MKKLTVICMTLFAMFCAVSCRGPVGPEGPAGPEGNANVGSYTITIKPESWRFEGVSWRVDVRYEAISEAITDHGAVLVYMDDMDGGNTWRQLPYTFYYSEFDDNQVEHFISSSLEVSSYDNGVTIFWTESNFSDQYRPDEHRFKIVVIAASYYKARTDVDYSNYEAVKEAFQLKEETITLKESAY